MKIVLSKIVSRLPKMQRQVIKMRFWEGLTYNDIGKVVGRTGSRVQQIVTKFLDQAKVKLDVLK